MRKMLLNSTSLSSTEAPYYDVIDWFGHNLRMAFQKDAKAAQARALLGLEARHTTVHLGKGTTIEFQDGDGEWRSIASI